MNILIVDADPIFTTTMSSVLRNENYQVSIAKDGKEAAKALNNSIYSLVIIDMLMAYNNGLEVVNNIRQNTDTQDTPIIVVSNIANEQSLSNWKGVGADSYIEKPLNISTLLQKVTELSGKRIEYVA